MTPKELLRWREEQMLSQGELAALLGVHANTMARWEHGETRIPAMVDLALETLSGQRARLLRALRTKQEELAHQRTLKAIRQGRYHPKTTSNRSAKKA